MAKGSNTKKSFVPRTLKQLRIAYAQRGAIPKLSEKEQKRLERQAEADERASRLRERMRKSEQQRKRKFEKEQQDREVRQKIQREQRTYREKQVELERNVPSTETDTNEFHENDKTSKQVNGEFASRFRPQGLATQLAGFSHSQHQMKRVMESFVWGGKFSIGQGTGSKSVGKNQDTTESIVLAQKTDKLPVSGDLLEVQNSDNDGQRLTKLPSSVSEDLYDGLGESDQRRRQQQRSPQLEKSDQQNSIKLINQERKTKVVSFVTRESEIEMETTNKITVELQSSSSPSEIDLTEMSDIFPEDTVDTQTKGLTCEYHEYVDIEDHGLRDLVLPTTSQIQRELDEEEGPHTFTEFPKKSQEQSTPSLTPLLSGEIRELINLDFSLFGVQINTQPG